MAPESILPYPWLTPVYQQLLHSWQTKRFHHALLLQGGQGTGKSELNNYLAKSILCLNNHLLQPCGQCKSCTLAAAGNHPDWCLIDNKDAAIGIDEVRKAGDFVNKKSHIGTNQVILINNLEHMTEAAANALLKTLEEPSRHVYLLLTCNMPERLLATIRSRCNQITVNVADKSQAYGFLQSYHNNLNQHECDILLALSGNAPLKVLCWLQAFEPSRIEQGEQQFAQWLAGQLSTVEYGKILEQHEFERLLFNLLLKKELGSRLWQNQDAIFELMSKVTAVLNDAADNEHKVKGQNKSLAMLNLLSQLKAQL